MRLPGVCTAFLTASAVPTTMRRRVVRVTAVYNNSRPMSGEVSGGSTTTTVSYSEP